MDKYILIETIITGFFLAICTYTDLKEKCINICVCLIFGIIGMIYKCVFENNNLLSLLQAIIPGIFIMFVSIVSKESIGKGDAVVISTIGLYIGEINTIIILFNGLIASCITGIICILFIKKEKKYRLPFIPFVSLAFIFQMVNGGLV